MQDGEPGLQLLDERAVALPGHTLVLRVRIGAATQLVNTDDLSIVDQDGAPIPAQIFRVGVIDQPSTDTPSVPSPLSTRARAWLASRGRWEARPLGRGSDPAQLIEALPLGSWIALCEMPADLPRWISAGPTRCDLQRLDAGGREVVRGRRVLDDAATRVVAKVSADTADAARLAALLSTVDSPLERWRTLPISRALSGGQPTSIGPVGIVRIERPTSDPLDALAEQASRRWHAALGSLATVDPTLAERVADRLLVFVRLQSGQSVPVWPGEESGVGALLADLLDGSHQRAATWLAGLPDAGAWVIDDAGSIDPRSGRRRATFGVVNFASRPVMAFGQESARTSASSLTGSPELTAVPPRAQGTVLVTGSLPGATDSVPPVEVRIGSTTLRRAMNQVPTSAAPGIALGPLKPDWTMATFLASITDPDERPPALLVEPQWQTAATLVKQDSGWVLYLECAAAELEPTPAPADEVRIWIGPYSGTGFARAAAVLSIKDSGECSVQNPGGSVDPLTVNIVRDDKKWRALVPLPARFFEREKTLRIGIERTDRRGVHTGWPRMMLPSQDEPGRALIDLGSWEPAAHRNR